MTRKGLTTDMALQGLLIVPFLCIVVCAVLRRKSCWYLAAWIPLTIFTLIGLFGLLRSCSSSVGNGPEAGFAALGNGLAFLTLLPSALAAPILWIARPKDHPGQTILPLMTGILISAVTLFGYGLATQVKIPVNVFDGSGKPVPNQFIYQTTTIDGISRDGPSITTDAQGFAWLESKSWQTSTFKTTHLGGYSLEVTWQSLSRGQGRWSYRWSGGLRFGLDMDPHTLTTSPPPVLNLYLRRWNELEMPIIVDKIRLLLEQAKQASTAAVPNFGDCPESLQFIQELGDLSRDNSAQRSSISAILSSQAAMIGSFREITKSHLTGKAERSPNYTIKALIAWATQQDQVSAESLRALDLKLTQIGRRILETALPLVGDSNSSSPAFSHLKDLATPYLPQILERFPSAEESDQLMMLQLFSDLRLGFQQLGPLAKDAPPGFAMSILMAVRQWQDVEEIHEAFVIVENKEKEFQSIESSNRVAVEASFHFMRKQLQISATKLGSASSMKPKG